MLFAERAVVVMLSGGPDGAVHVEGRRLNGDKERKESEESSVGWGWLRLGLGLGRGRARVPGRGLRLG